MRSFNYTIGLVLGWFLALYSCTELIEAGTPTRTDVAFLSVGVILIFTSGKMARSKYCPVFFVLLLLLSLPLLGLPLILFGLAVLAGAVSTRDFLLFLGLATGTVASFYYGRWRLKRAGYGVSRTP